MSPSLNSDVTGWENPGYDFRCSNTNNWMNIKVNGFGLNTLHMAAYNHLRISKMHEAGISTFPQPANQLPSGSENVWVIDFSVTWLIDSLVTLALAWDFRFVSQWPSSLSIIREIDSRFPLTYLKLFLPSSKTEPLNGTPRNRNNDPRPFLGFLPQDSIAQGREIHHRYFILSPTIRITIKRNCNSQKLLRSYHIIAKQIQVRRLHFRSTKVNILRRKSGSDAQDIQRCSCTPCDIYESFKKAQIEIVGLPTACRCHTLCTWSLRKLFRLPSDPPLAFVDSPLAESHLASFGTIARIPSLSLYSLTSYLIQVRTR